MEPSRRLRGSAGANEETMSRRVGSVSARLILNRLVMSCSSLLFSSPVTSRGSSAMPQMGHDPGPERPICGCIGQVYSTCPLDLDAADFRGPPKNQPQQPWPLFCAAADLLT